MEFADSMLDVLVCAGVPLHMPNKEGARCLHTAAQAGHIGVVNTVLAKGEHVDVTTNVRGKHYRL